MVGTIAIGTTIITIETAWKAGVIGFLALNAIILGSIFHWLIT